MPLNTSLDSPTASERIRVLAATYSSAHIVLWTVITWPRESPSASLQSSGTADGRKNTQERPCASGRRQPPSRSISWPPSWRSLASGLPSDSINFMAAWTPWVQMQYHPDLDRPASADSSSHPQPNARPRAAVWRCQTAAVAGGKTGRRSAGFS